MLKFVIFRSFFIYNFGTWVFFLLWIYPIIHFYALFFIISFSINRLCNIFIVSCIEELNNIY